MKNTFKRIAAFAMTICMLLSVVPAVAFAEETETPAQSNSVTYNFDIHKDGQTYYNEVLDQSVAYAGNNLAASEAMRSAVATQYEGELNWKFHSASNVNTAYAYFGSTTAAYNIYLAGRDENGTFLQDYYAAFTIKSPGTGDYKLTLDYLMAATGAPRGSVYVMPASVTDIYSAMDYYDPVGSFNGESTKDTPASVTFANTVSMKAGKEYLIVFKVDMLDLTDLTEGRLYRSYLYLNSVTLSIQDSALDQDTLTYNFALHTDENGTATALAGKWLGPGYDTNNTTIADMYQAKTLHWKYHSHGSTTDGVAISSLYFGFGSGSNYDLYLRGRGKIDGSTVDITGFYAMTVRSPGTGKYALTLNYQKATSGASKGSVYILPGDTANADIPAALTPDNLVGSFNAKGTEDYDPATTTFDTPVDCVAGEEYLLVFTSDEYADATATASKRRANLFLSNVIMNRCADEIGYDFGLGNRGETYGENVTFSKRNLDTSGAGRNAVIARYDATGNTRINWKYTQIKSSNISNGYVEFSEANAPYNMVLWAKDTDAEGTVKTASNYYYAITIRSPGSGDYKLTLDYATGDKGAAESSIFILPGNTTAENVEAALTDANLIDNVCFESESSDIVGTSVTFDKVIPMCFGEEYLIVFRADAAASSGSCAMYLNDMRLTSYAAYHADGKDYATFEEAVRAAYDADLTVKLNADVAMDALEVPAGLTFDLNSKTLTVTDFVGAFGNIVDNVAGNNGLLVATGTASFNEENADVPLLVDENSYRFFDYKLDVDAAPEAIEDTTNQKFWFRFHFYTDDTCTELDQDAYALVAAGGSSLEVNADVIWNGEKLKTVEFVDKVAKTADGFVKDWATANGGATIDRWMYVIVKGFSEETVGTVQIKPVLTCNGVTITNGVGSYTHGEPSAAE